MSSSGSKRVGGVRFKSGRIYDSDNGKTCHQCRQKTRDFSASCKIMKKGGLCPIVFCHKCLLNRYGEKAEEVELLGEWNCPKCRGICNCSVCRKRQGLKPTGLLVHTAKEGGFGSVSEMLTKKGPENFGIERKVTDKVPVDGKENSVDGKVDASLTSTQNLDERKAKKMKRKGLKEIHNGSSDDPLVAEEVPTKEQKTKKRKHKDRKEDTDDGKQEGEEVQNVVKNNDAKGKKKWKRKDKFVEDGKLEGEVQNVMNRKDVEVKDKTVEDGKQGEEVQKVVNNNDVKVKRKRKDKAVEESRKVDECTMIIKKKELDPEPSLPEGTPLASVMGIDLPPEDVGHALQFLEFCSAFGEVLDFRKAQAESILGELLRQRSGRNGRPEQYSSVVRFHIQLLSLLQEDMGEEPSSIDQISNKNWFQDLGKCISDSESKDLLKELPTDCFSRKGGYDILDLSQKLRILTYLCDEAICTSKLRTWIDEQNEKIVESEKESKGKVAAAKDKAKLLKRKLQDEVAKLIIAKNGAPLSISEHEAVVSQIKSEAAEAHAELLEAEGILPGKNRRSDCVRTEPYLVDVDGRVFWKLKGQNNADDLLLQDLGTWDAVVSKENWFVYGVETKDTIDKYCSLRRKWFKSGSVHQAVPHESDTPRESDEENL